jgi:hypothetical protein
VRWRRVTEELISTLLILIWGFVIYDALTKAYPIFPLVFYDIIVPTAIILIHALILMRFPYPKGRWWVIVAALGMMIIPLTGLLHHTGFLPLGPEGLIFIPISLLIWTLGLWRANRAGRERTLSKETLEVKASETPKCFLKRCVKCGMEIPIASEQCPYCEQKQT